jgi:hypothetical protein
MRIVLQHLEKILMVDVRTEANHLIKIRDYIRQGRNIRIHYKHNIKAGIKERMECQIPLSMLKSKLFFITRKSTEELIGYWIFKKIL